MGFSSLAWNSIGRANECCSVSNPLARIHSPTALKGLKLGSGLGGMETWKRLQAACCLQFGRPVLGLGDAFSRWAAGVEEFHDWGYIGMYRV